MKKSSRDFPKKQKRNPNRFPEEGRVDRSISLHQKNWPKEPVSLEVSKVLDFRAYQRPVFDDRASGVLVLHWARQIGKSFTLAAWAVDRLISRPGRLVTVLSNSRDNGAEFLLKCVDVCELNHTQYSTTTNTPALGFENMRMELRVRARGKMGRIKVLAANPRTARGFSGDLILDEFAFHEDAEAIWEAAEPILSSNKDFLCRIASTGNGTQNLFHRLAEPAPETTKDIRTPLFNGPHMSIGKAGYTLSRVTRTQAHLLGTKIYDVHTGEEIEPVLARTRALDKRAYDQNYECSFDHSCYSLLTNGLVAAAERADVGLICEQNWSTLADRAQLLDGRRITAMEWLCECAGPLFAGYDVARKVDLSVITVMEKTAGEFRVRAVLRIRDMRLEAQKDLMREVCRLPTFRRCAIDMTGLGAGMADALQKEFHGKIQGVNFASSVPLTNALQREGRKANQVRVTEALALELLQVYEDGRIQHPSDTALRDDLCKPERKMTAGGRVSIAATRDAGGHADHFWSFALAIEAAAGGDGTFAYQSLRTGKSRITE